MDIEQASIRLQEIRDSLNNKLLGQSAVVEQVLVALLANGHVLIEGIPGLGKTLLVRAMANCFSGKFKRIQFTPDLMPADITGHVMYDMEKNRFRLRSGPIFTNLLLADEINRAPAKTQAALLEAMQERQVTLEGESKVMPKPFMVLATQNPIEQEGTYPLPEAELDRFLLKIYIDYPSLEDELAIAKKITTGNINDQDDLSDAEIISAEDVENLQVLASTIEVDQQVLEYTVRLVRSTRESAALQIGAGPRASIALLRAARAKALLQGQNFVTPDDVKSMALPVMRHRVKLAAEMEIEGLSHDQVLQQIMSTVEAPRV